MHCLKHYHWWFVMYAMLKPGGGNSCEKCSKIVHCICVYEGYGQQVTCSTCIEETPVETNSETYSHSKFISNKMKENENDISPVIGKTVTTKKRKVVPEEKKGEKKWLGRYLNKVTE